MIKVNVANNTKRKAIFVDETTTTLRQALESEHIDYSIGMTSLDGSTLNPGDLDKTFADFGIKEQCYLMVVVKADNAAATTIMGNAVVIESSSTYADIKLLDKYNKEALTLYEGEGSEKEAVFVVGAAKEGAGSINKFGVSFAESPKKDGKACVTIMLPTGDREPKDPKAWVSEQYGTALLMLKRVEDQYAAGIEKVKAEKAAIDACITVM